MQGWIGIDPLVLMLLQSMKWISNDHSEDIQVCRLVKTMKRCTEAECWEGFRGIGIQVNFNICHRTDRLRFTARVWPRGHRPYSSFHNTGHFISNVTELERSCTTKSEKLQSFGPRYSVPTQTPDLSINYDSRPAGNFRSRVNIKYRSYENESVSRRTWVEVVTGKTPKLGDKS
jgi:hypothetical protein